jgi:hypothetical protein
MDASLVKSHLSTINYMRRDSGYITDTSHSGIRQGGEFISNTEKGTDMNSRNEKLLKALELHEMRIYDARPMAASFSLDREGFQVATLRTALPETLEVLLEDGEGEIRRTYWPEIVELTRQTLVSDGRKPKYVFAIGTQKFTEDKSRGLLGSYSRQAHADFSDVVFDGAWKMLVKRGVPEEEAKRLDLMFVNCWKPFGVTVTDNPLAVLDWTSVDPNADVRGVKRGQGAHMEKDTISGALVCHNPDHRWFYLPEMTPEELWFFKQADSRENRADISKHTFHTSVKIGANESRARRSIAVRLILGFEPVANTPQSAL